MTDPVTLAVVGAGNRGRSYAEWTLDHPDRARVVAVAEPSRVRRDLVRAEHGIGEEGEFGDWRELLDRPKVADAVIVSTQDQQHREPAVALARHGYDVLLEKPMATSEDDCRAIAEAAFDSGVVFAVCHVLLYTPYSRAVRAVVESGRLGEIVSVQHLEPVGYWHQAHSYVRGPWRREDGAMFMLMTKSCHDIDWLQHVVGSPVARVSSFGGLQHFTAAHRPAEASDRCVSCVLHDSCPYSATTLYRGLLERGATGWPLRTVVDEPTSANLEEALATGPYGRCVYACDNDVVDHQVVSMQFESGATGSFTMTGFNEMTHRRTRIFGTHGELTGDGTTVEVVEFGKGREVVDATAYGDPSAGGGHGGGDGGLMDAFVHAVATRDPSGLHSDVATSLSSHATVFAAERARRNGTVERLSPERINRPAPATR